MNTGNNVEQNTSIYYARYNSEGSKWIKLYQEGFSPKKQVIRAIAKSEVIRRYWRRGDYSGNEAGYITWFNIKQNDPEYIRMLESWEGDVAAGEENPYAGHIAWSDFIDELNREGVYGQEAQNLAGAVPRIIGSANVYKRFYEESIWNSIFEDMSEVRGLIIKVGYPGNYESAPEIYEPGTMTFSVFGSGVQDEDGSAAEKSDYIFTAKADEVDLTEYIKGQENPFADPSLTAFSELRDIAESNAELVNFYKRNTNIRESSHAGGFITEILSKIPGISLIWGLITFGAEVNYAGKSMEEKQLMAEYDFAYRHWLSSNIMLGEDPLGPGGHEATVRAHEEYGSEILTPGPGKRARQLRREAYEMYGDPRDRSGRRGLQVAQKDLRNRRRAIELLLPEIIVQAVLAWPEEAIKERYEYVYSKKGAGKGSGTRYEGYLDEETIEIHQQALKDLKVGLETYDAQKLSLYLPFEVSAAIKRLMVSLLGQPNTAFVAYDLLKDHYNEDKLNRKAVKSINEYVDQSYWRFVPDDAALENWKIVLHDQSPELPDEPVFRFKKSTGNDQWMSQLLKISRTISASGKNPGQIWLEQQAREGKADLESIKNELIAPAEEDINQLSIPDSSVGAALTTPGIEQTSQPQQAKVNLSGADLVSGLEQLSAELEVTGVEGAQLELSVDMGESYAAVEAGPPAGSDGAALPQMPSITIEEGITFEGQRGGGYLIRAEVELEDLRRLFEKAEDYLPEGGRFSTTEARISGAAYQAPPPQVVYKFDKGSVQIHTQKISPERLGSVFIDFLRQYSQAQ